MSRKSEKNTESIAPIAEGPVELSLVLGAILTVGLVALWFALDVNRVFDVPKALALKVGGCGIFLIWLLYGLFGPGFRWGSIKLFVAPVFALTGAVVFSTFFSIDVPISVFGVYERQFGLQGFLGCVGLFVVTATCLRSRRGAVMGLIVLAAVGAIMGGYAMLQATGHDPYGFFKKPHNKVYSTLGNATFAGNALALIFPISTVFAVVAGTNTIKAIEKPGAGLGLWVLGLVGVGLLQLGPGYYAGGSMSVETAQTYFKFGVSASLILVLATVCLGSWGPEGMRAKTEGARRAMDTIGAGALGYMALAMAAGLVFTRTRGAWVGTGVAVIAALVLLPKLMREHPAAAKIKMGCIGLLASFVVGLPAYVLSAPTICPEGKNKCRLFAKTLISIPQAFDPTRKRFGKGQGTRRHLWAESPRVLYNHGATLDRQYKDQEEYAKNVRAKTVPDVYFDEREPPNRGMRGLRQATVWLFGIGIETYRYAFMSHKSKRLEELDPMTNHDNPHNNYLYILASFGILGLLSYVWLLWRLLSQAYRRFDHKPRSILISGDDQVIKDHSIDEQGKEPKLLISTEEVERVSRSIESANLGAKIKVKRERARVVLSGIDPAQITTQLGAAPLLCDRTLSQRALAFGIVLSFFSYTIYSIAGFDSVCCSVFLFFLLGCSAVLFEPAKEESPRAMGVNILRHYREFRRQDPSEVPNVAPMGLNIVLVLLGGPLLAFSIWGGINVYRAERAFVGDQKYRPRSQLDYVDNKISNIKRAIRINPNESFYKQNLGTTYASGARLLRGQASKARQQGNRAQMEAYLTKSNTYSNRALVSLFAALDHAWAPENIFISLFQIYYPLGQKERGEAMLERALEHSPHLGAVRANLAVLKSERGAFKEALVDCYWVTEVDRKNATAWRTCGWAHWNTGDPKEGGRLLRYAARLAPKDPIAKRYLERIKKEKAPAAPPKSQNGSQPPQP